MARAFGDKGKIVGGFRPVRVAEEETLRVRLLCAMRFLQVAAMGHYVPINADHACGWAPVFRARRALAFRRSLGDTCPDDVRSERWNVQGL
jgi:hypothetical protein